MNISPSSWHFRLWMYFITKSPLIGFFANNHDDFRDFVMDDDSDRFSGHWEYHPPTNLCTYVNRLPFFFLLWAAMASAVALFIGVVVVNPFMELFLDIWYGQLIGDTTFLAITEIIIAVILGGAFLVMKYRSVLPKPVAAVMHKMEPTMKVISTFLSDRHYKICRKITFEVDKQ